MHVYTTASAASSSSSSSSSDPFRLSAAPRSLATQGAGVAALHSPQPLTHSAHEPPANKPAAASIASSTAVDEDDFEDDEATKAILANSIAPCLSQLELRTLLKVRSNHSNRVATFNFLSILSLFILL